MIGSMRSWTAIVIALAVEAAVIAALLTIALDVWTHTRVEQLGGVNVWGYRGPVLLTRQPDEIRIAIAGGDLAFGWGQGAGGTLAYETRRLVMLDTDRPGKPRHPMISVNIAAQGLTPAEYGGWLRHFAYLRPDVICIVADPRNHLSGKPAPVPDRKSAAFALFGYVPILPLVLREKGEVSGSSLLIAIGRAAGAIDHAAGRVVGGAPAPRVAGESQAAYLAALEEVLQTALNQGAAVVLVAPPGDSAGEASDRQAVAAMVATRFGPDRRVRFQDLSKEPQLTDWANRPNGFDFSSAGIANAARLIAPPVSELVKPLLD